MSVESRVENLIRAAERAEREGNRYVATALRKMAEDLAPPNLGNLPRQLSHGSR
jgi:hypothetical protein